MRKEFLFIFLAFVVTNTIKAQTKGNKVGYIDMEYILQNVPNYTEATIQLEQKAQKWKQEIEVKKIEIKKLTEALKAEKPLLTKELIEERESDIKFLENEILDYQQKRFGANGDLIHQKTALAKPIQDQVFTAVQDIAEAKKYDIIFDKSSDMSILFAAKRFDISDQVLRVINKTEKREKLTKKQLEAEEALAKKEDAIDENPVLSDRQKALEEKKAAREKLIADRKLALEQIKKENDAKRQQAVADREAKKSGTVSAPVKTEENKANTTSTNEAEAAAKKALEAARQKQIDDKAKATAERNKVIEDRKKALEEKRKKILEEREAIKKANEEKRLKTIEENDAAKKAKEEEKIKENTNPN